MTDTLFPLRLARLVAAMAWVDNDLNHDEINVLKGVLEDYLTELNAEDWRRIEMYLATPIGDDERERILQDLLEVTVTADQKRRTMDVLRDVVQVDGKVTDDEERALDDVRQALDQHATHPLAALGRMVKRAVGQRAAADGGREARFDDFRSNPVYFHLASEFEESGEAPALDEPALRRACLLAGMLADIAGIDRDFTDAEHRAMAAILTGELDVPPELADRIARAAAVQAERGIDLYRLARAFGQMADRDERRRLIERLFAVAWSDELEFEEGERIAVIAKGLDLGHDDYIAAKLRAKEAQGG